MRLLINGVANTRNSRNKHLTGVTKMWYSKTIYAFKPQPDRYLCFFKTGKKIIVTNAFRKKGDKLPAQEKALAIKNMDKYYILHKDQEEK